MGFVDTGLVLPASGSKTGNRILAKSLITTLWVQLSTGALNRLGDCNHDRLAYVVSREAFDMYLRHNLPIL
jgi:hypothetical protein